MRYHISGTDRQTGQWIKLEIDAITFESAIELAGQKGVLVQSCQGLGDGGALLVAPKASADEDNAVSLTLIIVGEVCALVSLLFCPMFFALAAFVISIVLLIRGRMGWGIAIMAQSVVFGILGLVFGALVAIASL